MSSDPRRRPPRLVTGSTPEPAPAWLPDAARDLWNEVGERVGRLASSVNEYGYDPFGQNPRWSVPLLVPTVWMYRNWFRVETSGIENVPPGRVLLIANHAGNTFAWDAAMLSVAVFLGCDPPRLARGMAEYYLPTIPFFNVAMQRIGSVVGTPENCRSLLEYEEAVMVFPEGQRGFIKPYKQAYQLQEFGPGFLRLALATGTPIVPVGIVGSEEQSPGLSRAEWLGRLIGAPALPITATFPLLGLAGAIPLPVKFHIHFGIPLEFVGDPNDDDAAIERAVDIVKDRIRSLVGDGLARRKSWFT
jgi:1-acyl-sn-glycerol-3-phosphate acyltransferase